MDGYDAAQSRLERTTMRARCTALVASFVVTMALAAIAHTAAETSAGGVDVGFPDDTGTLRLTGHLYRPDGRGSLPAVVLLHECDGIDPRLHRWANTLRQWGYVALIVDSLGARRATGSCRKIPDAEASPRFVRMPDAYSAKRYLESRPFVSRDRIAIMGWGYGGWALLYAIDEVYLTEMSTPPFKAAIALYPWCVPGFRLLRLNAPLLIVNGEADEWALVCRTMLRQGDREASTGPTVALKVYAGALQHAEDVPIEVAARVEHDVRRFLAQYLFARTMMSPER